MRCTCCQSDVEPVPPRTIGKILLVVSYVAALAIATVFSCLLGLNLVLAPAAIVIGMAVGTAARMASAWTCPSCKEEMFVPEPLADVDVGRPERAVRAGQILSPQPV